MVKISAELKIKYAEKYLSGNGSHRSIAAEAGVALATFQQWLRNYKSMGPDVFFRTKNKGYSSELKLAAVTDYLNNVGTFNELCFKYKIRSTSKLQAWVKGYNNNMELKSSRDGGQHIMTKGRKTTFEERIEIVEYCISQNKNYSKTAEKYKISYQQARSYVVKYENNGVESLKDNRGKRKDTSELNEIDKLKAEIKLLKAEKRKTEMEASFLKKLAEIERRWK